MKLVLLILIFSVSFGVVAEKATAQTEAATEKEKAATEKEKAAAEKEEQAKNQQDYLVSACGVDKEIIANTENSCKGKGGPDKVQACIIKDLQTHCTERNENLARTGLPEYISALTTDNIKVSKMRLPEKGCAVFLKNPVDLQSRQDPNEPIFIDGKDLDASSTPDYMDTSYEKKNINMLLVNTCYSIYDKESTGFPNSVKKQLTLNDKATLKLCQAHSKINCALKYQECVNQGITGSGCPGYRTCLGEDFDTKITEKDVDKNSPPAAIAIAAMIRSCDSFANVKAKLDNFEIEKNREPQVQSIDGAIQCTRGAAGLALDYQSCVEAVNAHNAGYIGADIAGETGIQLFGQIEDSEIQTEAAQQSTLPTVEGQTAAIDATRKKHILERDKNRARMGFQGAKGIGMTAVLSRYITPAKVAGQWCTGSSNLYDILAGDACVITHMAQNDENIVSSPNGDIALMNALFPNQAALGQLKAGAAQALTQAIVAGLIANIKDKQAKLVGKVKEAFVGAAFNQPNQGIDTTGLPKFCDENPTAPSCQNFINNQSGQGSGVEFGFGGFNSTPNTLDLNDDESGLAAPGQRKNSAVSGTGSNDNNDLFGDSSGSSGSSKLANKVAAGNISTARRSGGGGGGGGSAGGGGGGASGGGGSKKAGAAPQGPLGNKSGSSFVSGNSSKGFVSGNSTRPTRSKENAFSRVVPKRSGRSIASGDKNLLPKNIRLFQAISKRYSAVSNSGRLVEISDRVTK